MLSCGLGLKLSYGLGLKLSYGLDLKSVTGPKAPMVLRGRKVLKGHHSL
jgi:hypothetical protein